MIYFSLKVHHFLIKCGNFQIINTNFYLFIYLFNEDWGLQLWYEIIGKRLLWEESAHITERYCNEISYNEQLSREFYRRSIASEIQMWSILHRNCNLKVRVLLCKWLLSVDLLLECLTSELVQKSHVKDCSFRV